LKTAAYNSVKLVTDAKDLITGASFDQGACCQSQILFNSFIGTKKTPAPTDAANNSSDSLG
jgi:hypothetical protein